MTSSLPGVAPLLRGLPICLALLVGCVNQDSSGTLLLEARSVGGADLHIVGTSDSVATIVDLMPLDDDSVWILNNTDPFLVRLSADGEEIEVQTRRGQGPGEFSWPSTLVRDGATDVIWVFDTTAGNLMSVEGGASGSETVAFPLDSGGVVRMSSYEWLWMNNGGRVWIRAFDDGFVFARPTFTSPWILSLWSTSVVRLGRDGSLETVLSTSDVVGDPSDRFPGASRFLPYPIWAACPDGSLALYDPNQNVVRRFSATGEPIVDHELPAERRVEITTDRIFDTVYPQILRNRAFPTGLDRDEVYLMIKRDYEDRADEFSAFFPEYADLDCAGGNTLWVQLFDSAGGQMGRGPVWLRITDEGAQGQVSFPASFRPMRFYGDRIWGVDRGEFDVDYVAWVETPAV